jgi:malate dehydrogenase (oxaloacetate-decarboxylating)
MVLESAYALADYTAAHHLDAGKVYPPIRELQEVSIRVANRVMECAIKEGLARQEGLENCDLDTYLRKRFWKPRYLPFVRGA